MLIHPTFRLTTTTTASRAVKVTASDDKINISILHALLGIEQVPQNSQVLNIIKAVGLGLGEREKIVQPHVLYIIEYRIDPVQDVISAGRFDLSRHSHKFSLL